MSDLNRPSFEPHAFPLPNSAASPIAAGFPPTPTSTPTSTPTPTPPVVDQPGFARRSFADQLSIETPEQVALEFPLAGLGSRFVAVLIDHLIQFAVVFSGFLLFGTIAAAFGSHGFDTLPGKWFIAGIIFVVFLLYWGYFALFEAFSRGQTPGKRVMKLRVIKDAGRQITLFESLARNLLRVVDYFPSLYLVGAITMLANKRNKRLGDLAAGTLVIHERGDDQPLLYTGIAPRASKGLFSQANAPFSAPPANEPWQGVPGTQTLFAADAIARLGTGDLVIIETFFARALDLPLETRAAMAYRIAGELAAKMRVPVPEGNPERTLEAIVIGVRGQGRRL